MAEFAEIDEKLAKLKGHKMGPAERRAQRVSLIMGLRADRSTLTREKVEEVLDEVEGTAPARTTSTTHTKA